MNGEAVSEAWAAPANDEQWKSMRIPNAALRTGDEIRLETTTDGGALAKLDYVQVNLRSPARTEE